MISCEDNGMSVEKFGYGPFCTSGHCVFEGIPMPATLWFESVVARQQVILLLGQRMTQEPGHLTLHAPSFIGLVSPS